MLLLTIHNDVIIPSELEQVVIACKHLEEANGDLTVQIKEN